jgi:uncharacterized protein (TIGR03032 family)
LSRAGRINVSSVNLNTLWSRHDAQWRHPGQISSQWQDAANVDPRLLRYRVSGAWWDTLEKHRITLLVTREYEHLIMAMSVGPDGPSLTYMAMPHPSGLAVDRKRGVVHLASTRNPNQVFALAPATGPTQVLVPIESRFYPGSLRFHDLAMIGDELYANAVGQNAVVRIGGPERFERVWWPRCIEGAKGPIFNQNHIQLNSIAAGADLEASYFSASADRVSWRRPGQRNFPVDGRGVIFSGATREPVVRGLTRPHSARLHRGRLWVDNSGYGEVGTVRGERFEPVARLSGWTRGLCFHRSLAFVGTSRVIPRFSQYAPGLDAGRAQCGVHAVDTRTGRVIGSLIWPYGNQIFSVDWVERSFASALPFRAGRKRATARQRQLFYDFSIKTRGNRVNA